MTINHIDQLTEWWEGAERGVIRAGDTVIQNHRTAPDEYTVYVAEQSNQDSGEYVRILARTPQPKPAWHDAVAVTATATDDLGDEITAVWVREGDELWRSDEGGMVLRDDLRDVTPLIEAKVTDEMLYRGLSAYYDIPTTTARWDDDRAEDFRRALHAALGLDPA